MPRIITKFELKNLIAKCWDANSEKRPTASELVKILQNWKNWQDTEFTKQLREVEEHNKTLPETITKPTYQIHPSAVYTSRWIDTSSLKSFSQSQNSEKINNIILCLLLKPISWTYSVN